MSLDDYKKDFESLELTREASLSEVKKSYQLLTDLYSNTSLVTMSVEDEISDEGKKEILDRIETAYRNLLTLFEEVPEAAGLAGRQHGGEELKNILAEITTFSGAELKQIREKLNVGLHEISLVTKVHTRHLINIEEGNFNELPHEVYTRGFIMAYAKYLSLEPKIVADDYMTDYRIARAIPALPSRFW